MFTIIGSHSGRVRDTERTESVKYALAFCKIFGINPIPASELIGIASSYYRINNGDADSVSMNLHTSHTQGPMKLYRSNRLGDDWDTLVETLREGWKSDAESAQKSGDPINHIVEKIPKYIPVYGQDKLADRIVSCKAGKYSPDEAKNIVWPMLQNLLK